MKGRLVQSIIAAALAVAILIPGTARPVRAVPLWVNIAVSIATSLLANSGGASNGDLERAKREIIAAVENSKREILDHIDSIAEADVRSCTESAVTKIAQIDNMPGSLLGPFINGAVDCAFLSANYFNAVQNLGYADNIGKLMGVIFSIAMVGFAKFGLSITDLLNRLITGYQSVVTKLAPRCSEERFHEEDSMGRPVTVEIIYTCVAYDGHIADDYELYYLGRPTTPPIDRAAVDRAATLHTSRGTAQDALPALIELRDRPVGATA